MPRTAGASPDADVATHGGNGAEQFAATGVFGRMDTDPLALVRKRRRGGGDI